MGDWFLDGEQWHFVAFIAVDHRVAACGRREPADTKRRPPADGAPSRDSQCLACARSFEASASR